MIFTGRDRLSLATAGEWYTMKLIRLLRDRGGDLAIWLVVAILLVLVFYRVVVR